MKTNSMMSIDDALDAKFNELVVSCMKIRSNRPKLISGI